MMKELTCGSFGNLIWYHWCFTISLDDNAVMIEVPFHKKTIALSQVKKLESMKAFLQPRHFKLTYDDNGHTTKFIRFFSGNPSVWFNELQRLGVKTEDTLDLKNIKEDRFFQFAKRLNLTVGLIVAVCIVGGMAMALFSLLVN